MSGNDYIGRFAPSPSGPLHFGSLVAALASWLDARHHHGQWLMRIEDIDPPREIPAAAGWILDSLRIHGLHWDGDVLYQSKRSTAYEQALQQLQDANQLYACTCTRKAIRASQQTHSEQPNDNDESSRRRCPGNCWLQNHAHGANPLRLRTPDHLIRFDDLCQGSQTENVADGSGDFIVRRRDRLHAYQLAVVVDDDFQKVNTVVRGDDLLCSSARQILLQQLLNYPTPSYLHLPVVLDKDGRKLSKQTGAQALDNGQPVQNLISAWRFLGQPLEHGSFADSGKFLQYAVPRWSRRHLQAMSMRNNC